MGKLLAHPVFTACRMHTHMKLVYLFYSELDVGIPYLIVAVISLKLFRLVNTWLYKIRIYIRTCINFVNDQLQQIFAL